MSRPTLLFVLATLPFTLGSPVSADERLAGFEGVALEDWRSAPCVTATECAGTSTPVLVVLRAEIVVLDDAPPLEFDAPAIVVGAGDSPRAAIRIVRVVGWEIVFVALGEAFSVPGGDEEIAPAGSGGDVVFCGR